MILHYFAKKENTEKGIANDLYIKILKKSKIFLNNNKFFNKKDYNTSFEIVTFIIITYINLNISNHSNYLKIN